jgi:hypothetical protein
MIMKAAAGLPAFFAHPVFSTLQYSRVALQPDS